MTIPAGQPASLTFMQPTPLAPQRLRLLFAAACWFLPNATARAQEPPLSDLLRDGLYAEEVTRDAEAAAKQYEQVLARYAEQREFAATALFRLAEVRRKQDRKDDAIQLYQRFLTEFPDSATQAKLARENLATLGAKVPEPGALAIPEETRELQRLEQLAKSSPDLLRKPGVLVEAVKKGWSKPVAFVLDQLSSPESKALVLNEAAREGHLGLIQMVLARGVDPKGDSANAALCTAVEANNLEVVKYLLAAGTSPDGKTAGEAPELSTPLLVAVRGDKLEIARMLLEKGADVNLMPRRCMPHANVSADLYIGGPLHEAICFNKPKIIDLLLEHKADVNLAEPRSKITPLWLAAKQNLKGSPELVKRLLDLGANPDAESAERPKNETWPNRYAGHVSPLELAISESSVDCVKLILAAKKARNTPVDNPYIIQTVLSLSDAAIALEITRLLLDHGADPNPPDLLYKSLFKRWSEGARITEPKETSLLEEVAKSKKIANAEELLPIIELLLERGSKVDPKWEATDFGSARGEIRPLLIRRISYPKWAAEKTVRLIDYDSILLYNKVIATPQNAADVPPALARLLLTPGLPGDFYRPYKDLVLIRRSGSGTTEKTVMHLDGTEPFPTLKWGDILEMSGADGPRGAASSRWPPTIQEALEKRVAALPPSNP